MFFFNFFSVASWVVEKGTGFSDMDAGMWLVSAFFKIEYWNFQDKLLLWFREASQNLSFLDKNCQNYTLFFFSIFPLVPHWKPWKKSCLNKLKFWEASRNQKRSICWKFQLSISLGRQKFPSTIQPRAKLNKPFWIETRFVWPLGTTKAHPLWLVSVTNVCCF